VSIKDTANPSFLKISSVLNRFLNQPCNPTTTNNEGKKTMLKKLARLLSGTVDALPAESWFYLFALFALCIAYSQ
jgi:hypothetical protein